MSNYVVTTDFAAKDALASGNPNKIAQGTQVATELNNIATAIATKEDTADKGQANGYASLDANGEVPSTQISEDSVTQYEAAMAILETQITDGALLARVASTETISAIWTFTARPAFNGGTSGSSSPFTVDSTQVVTNLNADLLDGENASAFADASHVHSADDITSGTLPIARGGTGNSSGLARNIGGKSGTGKTLSTSAPSGGGDGDIWYRYS